MTKGEEFKYAKVAEAFKRVNLYGPTEEPEHKFLYRKAYDIACKYEEPLIVEYGTLNGASAISIGMGILYGKELMNARGVDRNPKLLSVDNYMAFHKGNNQQIVSVDRVREIIRECKLDNSVSIIEMDDLTHIATLSDKSVNMAWVDSLHEYEHVKETLDLLLPKMADDSFLCGHDYDYACIGVVYAVEEFKKKWKEHICGFGVHYKNWWCIIRNSPGVN